MRLLSFLLLAGACALTGCADYMSHRDSVTLGVGDAMLANQGIQTIDPFPPDARNTKIEGDGRRVAAAMGFRQKASAGGGANVDLDCAGGKGNNPVVQGPVDVSGGDPNHLDRDHDGVGCE
ncbi:excalibur calcium-binding domain-containing protein [Mesorhizobium sp. Cs1321R2N1]|uniref:excalibur calcium-binding domain-containing protein n=1 Tax=Mesorhizobium sp. Cs1321R2N1 TaxID=3015174 RepID=UPI00301B9875